jgi:hypothetical protein
LDPQAVDEEAPLTWKRMLQESSSDFVENLDEASKGEINQWSSRRAALLRLRMQKEMERKLELLDLDLIHSTPFVKALVGNCGQEDDSNEAILTIWKPSSEQLDMLREGAALRVKNLDTKSGRFEGLRQFTGNASTAILTLSSNDDPALQVQLKRKYSTLFSVYVESKAHWKDLPSEPNKINVNVVGVVLKVKKVDNPQGLWIYLTDKSHLILRIHCNDVCDNLTSLLKSDICDGEVTKILEFDNVQVLPFDVVERCAVVQYRKISHFAEKTYSQRAKALRRWSSSKNGYASLQKLRLYVDIGVQEVTNPRSRSIKAIGYISGLHVLSSHPQIILRVDCGDSTLQTWKFPLALISAFAGSCEELNKAVVLNAEEEMKLTQLTKIGHVYRARKNLFCFTLQRIQVSSITNQECDFEVSCISAVDARALAALYLVA